MRSCGCRYKRARFYSLVLGASSVLLIKGDLYDIDAAGEAVKVPTTGARVAVAVVDAVTDRLNSTGELRRAI